MIKLHNNLPHIYNSCGVNAIFVALSYLDVDSNDILIKHMLDYCKDSDEKLTFNHGITLMKGFYTRFNISPDIQNSRDLLNKFYNLLEFENSQIELGDYEKIELTKRALLLDYEQIKNMVEYNLNTKQYENRVLPYVLNKDIKTLENFEFSHTDLIQYKDNIYAPCIYVVCLNQHYLTLINVKQGLIIYDDLHPVRFIEKKDSMKIIDKIHNIDFIGYIKVDINKNN